MGRKIYHWGRTTLPNNVDLNISPSERLQKKNIRDRMTGNYTEPMRKRHLAFDNGYPNYKNIIAKTRLSMYEEPFLLSYDRLGRVTANVTLLDDPIVYVTLHPVDADEFKFDTELYSIKTRKIGEYHKIKKGFKETLKRPYQEFFFGDNEFSQIIESMNKEDKPVNIINREISPIRTIPF